VDIAAPQTNQSEPIAFPSRAMALPGKVLGFSKDFQRASND
jgi:hypothetical protein